MNDNLQNVLAQLAQKLGTGVDHLYAALLIQARVTAVYYGLVIAATILMTILAIRGIKQGYKVVENNRGYSSTHFDDNDLIGIMAWVKSFTAIILLVISAIILNDFLTAIFNPQYYALYQIIEKLKP